MSQYTHEIVMVCTVTDRDAANLLAVAMDHDDYPGRTFAIPLSDNGTDTTHYGCCAYVIEEFAAMITGVLTDGTLPDAPWEAAGLSAELVLALMSRMFIRFDVAGPPRSLWESVLSEHGLVEWVDG